MAITKVKSKQVTSKLNATDAVVRGLDDKLAESVSVLDFGADNTGATNCFSAVSAAWTYCLANGKDLYFPSGTYSVKSENNFPFGRIDGLPPVSLLDCKNITIFGDGPTTILRTDTIGGGDVLQFNGAKNLHVRNLKLTATITGSDAGSNGISVTGGFDNITIDDVWCENLASLDKTTYVDGGKALTLQLPSSGSLLCGTLTAKMYVKGCAEGFGYEPDLDVIADQPTSVTVDMVAEDCYQAFKYAAAAASGALSVGMESGLRVRGTAINCQQDVILGRMHGGIFDITVVTTKTEAARRLNPQGVAWFAGDTTVLALNSQYAKNAEIRVTGDKGGCAYKALIGGAVQGASGLNGATEFCNIYLDIAGAASVADISAVDSGGNSLRSSKLTVTASTSATLPSDFAITSKKNVLEVIGEYGQAVLPGNIRFPAAQVSSSDANTLDDYEEGTWTPILGDTSLSPSEGQSATSYGFYTKVGNLVTFNMYMAMSSLGTLTTGDAAFVLGLPFTSQNTPVNISSVAVGFCSNLNMTSAGDIPMARIGVNENVITLGKWAAAATAATTPMTVAEVSVDGVLVLSGSYRTAT